MLRIAWDTTELQVLPRTHQHVVVSVTVEVFHTIRLCQQWHLSATRPVTTFWKWLVTCSNLYLLPVWEPEWQIRTLRHQAQQEHRIEGKSSPSVGFTWLFMNAPSSRTTSCFLFAHCAQPHNPQKPKAPHRHFLDDILTRGRGCSSEAFCCPRDPGCELEQSKAPKARSAPPCMQYKVTAWDLQVCRLFYRILLIYHVQFIFYREQLLGHFYISKTWFTTHVQYSLLFCHTILKDLTSKFSSERGKSYITHFKGTKPRS